MSENAGVGELAETEWWIIVGVIERNDLNATWYVVVKGQRGYGVHRKRGYLGDDFPSLDEILALWEVRPREKVFNESYADVVAPAERDGGGLSIL